jgi:hypothetical protein
MDYKLLYLLDIEKQKTYTEENLNRILEIMLFSFP